MNLIKELPRIEVSYKPITKVSDRMKISCPSDAHELFRMYWDDDTIQLYESFKVAYLNRANAVIGVRELCRGSGTNVLVDIRLLFAIGLACSCNSIVLAHNHPSGNLKASRDDDTMTEKIKKVCGFFDFELLDHLILTAEGYYSYSEDGKL